LPVGAPGEDPIYANVITGNGAASSTQGGIYGFLGASLDIRYAEIRGNTGDGVILRLRSTARMFGDTVSGNSGNGILLDLGGGLLLSGPPNPPVTATGNGSRLALDCFGGESSFAGVFAAGSQPVSGACTPF